MNRPLKLMLLFLLLNAGTVYAHQDFWISKTFGKIQVRINTGFSYEEVDKVWIIGQLADELRKSMHYEDAILLDFNHHYVRDCLPDYFIAHDNGAIKQTWSGGETIPFAKNKALVIRSVSRKFDAVTTLKLIEYAMHNVTGIKQDQKPLKYEKNYCQWLINSIDTAVIRKISLGSVSVKVGEILKQRVYGRSKKEREYAGISYYFQYNKYHIYTSVYQSKDSVILITDNIYQFDKLSYDKAVVFNTDSTFYIIRAQNTPVVSRKLEIVNKCESYRPYETGLIGTDKVMITFEQYCRDPADMYKKRTVVYRINKNELVQDLDKVLDRPSYF